MQAMGEYFASNGLGISSRGRPYRGPAPLFGTDGMGEYFQPAAGMGEYFAYNGMGVDEPAPEINPEATKWHWLGMFAVGGLAVGLVGAMFLKKNKLVGSGVGAAAGLAAGYFIRPA